MIELTRRSLLQGLGAAAAATAIPSVGRSGAADKAYRLVIVNAAGGWDISYALDPKPGLATVDSPEGEVQLFGDIPILVHETRPAVTSFFETWADRTAVIHGLGMRSISHVTCEQKIFTGHPSTRSPDPAAIIGHELARELPLPYLVLGSTAFSGALGVSTGRVGAVNQIKALLPPGELLPTLDEFQHGGFEPSAADEALIRSFLEARVEREQATRGAEGYNARRIADFRESLLKADAVRDAADGFGAFDLESALYPITEQVDFAVRALREDLSWTVGISTNLDWDTHDENYMQGPLHETLFAGLDHLATRLAATPGQSGSSLLDETLVLVVSEMSRTPLLNANGGKDHWSTTSTLMFGGPVQGGRVWGASTDRVEPELMDLATGELDPNGLMLEPRHMLAGVIAAAGVDASTYFPNVEAFRAPFA